MRTTSFVACILLTSACQAVLGQTQVKLTQVFPERNTTNRLYVTYGEDPSTAGSLYGPPATWRAWRSDDPSGPYTEVPVDPTLGLTVTHKVELSLKDPSLTEKTLRCSYWTVQFNTPGQPSTVLKYVSLSPGKECEGTVAASTATKKPFLSPPGPNASADISVSGSFIAGGGTKPLYTFEIIGALYAADPVPQLLEFSPGVSATVEINQGQTSTDRTTFDPDSISAAFSLQRFARFKPENKSGLVGMELNESLPAGEFSRADSTSNIIFGSTVGFAFRPIRSGKSHVYGTVFPVLGVEVGKNLNQPSVIAKVPVDLSHYDRIFRGLGGVDAQLAVVDKSDPDSDSFTLGGSYRVRLPALDEPFVETRHQVTTVSLSTRPRHWFEGNINWAPWSFKYLSLNAKYQYGELPPLFKLVDHSLSLGVTFKAAQRNRANRTDGP